MRRIVHPVGRELYLCGFDQKPESVNGVVLGYGSPVSCVFTFNDKKGRYMRYAYLRLFAASAIACGLFVPVAQAAPVANLPLTCPDAGAIGPKPTVAAWYISHPQPQLIVLKGPSSAATWARANESYELANTWLFVRSRWSQVPIRAVEMRQACGALFLSPKNQVFPDSPPPPSSSSGARVLDLSAPW